MSELDELIKGFESLKTKLKQLEEENIRLRKRLGEPIQSTGFKASEEAKTIDAGRALIALIQSERWPVGSSLRAIAERSKPSE
jgi:regulator of replication initiation timing